MIGFVASTISIKSSLSAISAFHGGGGLRGAGTGATTTHKDRTHILSILIRPTTPDMDTGMVTMAMATDTVTRLGLTMPAITAPRTTKTTMKV